MHKITCLGCTLLLSLYSIGIYAEEIAFAYSGTWTNVHTGDFGSTYTATFIFDNGGRDVANQTFTQSDFVSGRLVSGSYDFTMTSADILIWHADFASDGSGALSEGWVDLGTGGDHRWSFDISLIKDAYFKYGSGEAFSFESLISEVGRLVNPPPASIPTMSVYGLVATIFGLLIAAIPYLRRSAKQIRD